MTTEEKLEKIREYLNDQFREHTVGEAYLDGNIRYCFEIEQIKNLVQSRRLTIPQEAVDDLYPAEIIALLKLPRAEQLWKERISLHLRYGPVNGLDFTEPAAR